MNLLHNFISYAVTGYSFYRFYTSIQIELNLLIEPDDVIIDINIEMMLYMYKKYNMMLYKDFTSKHKIVMKFVAY